MRFLLIGVIALSGILSAAAPARAQEASGAGAPGGASLSLISDPPGAEIEFSGRVEVAPVDLELPSGRYLLDATLSGHELLHTSLQLAEGDTAQVVFTFRREAPTKPPPGELGLAYEMVYPPIPFISAYRIESTYWSLVETFAVIPLSQGLFLKMADPDATGSPAEEMILAGVGLVAGSYLGGKFLHARKVRQITDRNEEVAFLNDSAEGHNREVDQAIRLQHVANLAIWEQEGEGRGRVEVVRSARSTDTPSN